MAPALQPIAVIGMACRLPGADGADEFWANLHAGVESIERDETAGSAGDATASGDRFVRALGTVRDVEWFDADYFRVPPSEALLMDPQHRVLLEVAVAALEDAGYADAHDAAVGVFAGSGRNHYFNAHVAPAGAGSERDDMRAALVNEADFLAPRVSFKLGLTGPSISVQSGCSTSLTAVALACQALAAGDCDIALAGGVSLIMPDVEGYTYSEGGILSSDGRCRAFDRLATGTVPASGAAMVVLKREREALADRDCRRAVIRGWAVNNDGAGRAGFTVPGVEGQATVVRRALKRAGLTPADVSYIETHGTGTALGDPVEIEALRRVFTAEDWAPRTCAIGSVKASIGHTDAAAGVAGLIKATLAVQHASIPASLHFRDPNPEIDFAATPFFVNTEATPWTHDRRIAGVSSFGLGGTNAHVVLENAAPVEPAPPERQQQLVALSARSDDEMAALKLRIAEWLDSRAPITAEAFADAAYSLAVGRPRFARRWAGAFASAAEASQALREPGSVGGTSSRWTLSVTGTPDEFAAAGGRMLADPLVRETFARLAEDSGAGDTADSQRLLAALAPVQAGAIIVLSCARALQVLGMSFARVDAPPWVTPAISWLEGPQAPEDLATALAACTHATADAPRRTGGGAVALRPDFDLPGELARAWSAGADLDWSAYFDSGARRRLPLPTYPFTRRRFWLSRPATAAVPEAAPPAEPEPADEGVAAIVVAVWADVLGLGRKIDHHAHFVDDLDGDSLLAVEVGARLGERFGLELPTDLPFVAPTVAESTRYIEEALTTKVAT